MAYKKDIKPWLKENNHTWEDMDKFWEECCEVNWKCKMIKKSGKSWNDMTMYQIQQLPTLKETTLNQIKQKEDEEKAKVEAEKKTKEEQDYYREHFNEIIVNKIDSGEKLTEKEIETVVFETNEIEHNEGESLRWTRSIKTIVEMCGRYFCVNWDKGLTECQENDFYHQPYEVKKCTYEKTITVTEWSKIS